MSALSNYLADEVVDHLLRNQAFTPPTTLYLALFTADTGLNANLPDSEASYTGYAREVIALDAAADGVTANTATVEFDEASSGPTVITDVAIVDHLSNTNWGVDVNVLIWGALAADKTLASGETFRIQAGELDLTVT